MVIFFVDLNQCTHNNGGCAHICEDKKGTHKCKCRNGYTLANDGRGCTGKPLFNILFMLFFNKGLLNYYRV